MTFGRHPKFQVWSYQLDAIKSTAVNLTDWEKKFIDDIEFRFTTNQSFTLSEKQEQILERIYAERTP